LRPINWVSGRSEQCRTIYFFHIFSTTFHLTFDIKRFVNMNINSHCNARTGSEKLVNSIIIFIIDASRLLSASKGLTNESCERFASWEKRLS